MEKLIRVRAMAPCYIEPLNRPDLGKRYDKGEVFDVEPERFSDWDKVQKGKNGVVVRGCMKRIDAAAPAEPPAAPKKAKKPAKGSEEI